MGTSHLVKMSHVGTGTPVSLPRAKPRGPGRAKLGSPSTPKVPVIFDGKKISTEIHSREALKLGKTYSGPAIITEYSATTVIPPRKHFHLDHAGNLIVTIR
jgi:N-methylhydantoinase A/oxoprolinase/acetone carboxylase beta subunit